MFHTSQYANVFINQAVEDLELCLARRVASLPSDSRCIAETHYQLGIAQGFDMKWEEAVVSLEAAIKVLGTRVANLKSSTESPDESTKEDALYTREKEVTELEALIPEIREKITDTNEMKAESLRKMREAVGFPAGQICCCFHDRIVMIPKLCCVSCISYNVQLYFVLISCLFSRWLF